MAFHHYLLSHFAKLQLGVHGGRKAGGDDDSGLIEGAESRGRDGHLVGSWGQQIKQIAAVCLRDDAAVGHERVTFDGDTRAGHGCARGVGNHSRDLPGCGYLGPGSRRVKKDNQETENERMESSSRRDT